MMPPFTRPVALFEVIGGLGFLLMGIGVLHIILAFIVHEWEAARRQQLAKRARAAMGRSGG